MTEPIRNRVLRTEEDLAAYRNEVHAEILEKNPGRDFSVLFGGNEWPKKVGIIVVWHDEKSELL